MSDDKQEQHKPMDPLTDFASWPHLGPPDNYANYFFACCDDRESAVLNELGWSLPGVQSSGPSHRDHFGDFVDAKERPNLAGSEEIIAEDDAGVRSSNAAFTSEPFGGAPTSRSNPSVSSDSSEEDRTEKSTASGGENLPAETP